MKRILLLTACWLLALPALAQIDAYTTWPYYYPDFQQGTLTLSNGQTRVMPINIHLLKGDLHFVDEKGIIQMAPTGPMLSSNSSRKTRSTGKTNRVCSNSSISWPNNPS